MTHVLDPGPNPFLFIMWNQITGRLEINGKMDDKRMLYELLERAKKALDDHYAAIADDPQNWIERRRIILPPM